MAQDAPDNAAVTMKGKLLAGTDAKELHDSEQPAAGPSTGPLQSHTSEAEAAPKYGGHFASADVAFVPQGGEEPPPDFTPYEAEYSETSNGDIISHDPHLNEDGEALYRFLLAQSEKRPKALFHFCGTHTEYRTRLVSSTDSNGNSSTRSESYTETVEDFNFYVDVGQHIVHGPVHWSVPDDTPAYRGNMYKEVDVHAVEHGMHDDVEVGTKRREATKQEIKRARLWHEEQKTRGLPPWVGPGTPLPTRENLNPFQNVLKSSWTLRDWADDYCTSDKLLKEFIYKKKVYGWNISNLTTALTAAVRSAYQHDVRVEFQLSSTSIIVRPDNALSRTLSNNWLLALLWLLLIYPFIWLYKRFGRRGGGQWAVCGGAYALRFWTPVRLPPDPDTRDPPPPFEETGAIVHVGQDAYTFVGMREGEWFEQWEGTVRRAVWCKLTSRTPLTVPDYRPEDAESGVCRSG
ncbi:hypothetical protein OBBRIDRAFT_787580 [Obba rivulosa]|uniref:Uncharacterized protein n=1 Tax=Obba rivulosa TaxID=1052685 RepID=A0A8E2DUK1_9APHY|nr:hypothetical protein OBBRIDRAFT_787580 [Obba rivulosa]